MCLLPCLCTLHVDVLDMQHAARKDNFYRMPNRHKKVIDANVERGREGNRGNQLIKHFIRLVKPCGNFIASSEGSHSPFSASADNAVHSDRNILNSVSHMANCVFFKLDASVQHLRLL